MHRKDLDHSLINLNASQVEKLKKKICCSLGHAGLCTLCVWNTLIETFLSFELCTVCHNSMGCCET